MFRTDIWRVGIAHAPIADVLARGLKSVRIDWLPEKPFFQFDADPFGLWRGGELHVFVETYDYYTHHGAIDVLRFDASFSLLDRRPALRETWHLSYPFVFEADGETWMLPEAHRSGGLTLYRAARFPDRWKAVCRIALDAVAVDATPVWHGGLWWLLYSPGTAKTGALHAAYAERLTGPWTPHPGNPIRADRASSRPGGTPFVDGGAIVLPVQDCTRTYGGAIRPLRITALTPDRFEAKAGDALHAPAGAAPYTDGLHTLAAAGEVTLVDAKWLNPSWRRAPMKAQRKLRKLFG